MSLYPEIEKFDLVDLIDCFQAAPPDGEEYADNYYAEIALFIGKKGEAGIKFLEEKFAEANTERLRAIIFALSSYQSKNFNLQSILNECLSDQRPLIVAEAIDGLSRQKIRDSVEQVLALRRHDSPFIRGSVLRYMSKLYPEQSISMLIEALQDPSFIVRENAVDELSELGNAEVITYLCPLLLDQHPDVRQAAEFAIEALESNSNA